MTRPSTFSGRFQAMIAPVTTSAVAGTVANHPSATTTSIPDPATITSTTVAAITNTVAIATSTTTTQRGVITEGWVMPTIVAEPRPVPRLTDVPRWSGHSRGAAVR